MRGERMKREKEGEKKTHNQPVHISPFYSSLSDKVFFILIDFSLFLSSNRRILVQEKQG
jgi:hypothetical protein